MQLTSLLQCAATVAAAAAMYLAISTIIAGTQQSVSFRSHGYMTSAIESSDKELNVAPHTRNAFSCFEVTLQSGSVYQVVLHKGPTFVFVDILLRVSSTAKTFTYFVLSSTKITKKNAKSRRPISFKSIVCVSLKGRETDAERHFRHSLTQSVPC
jgi:hypothetical protein